MIVQQKLQKLKHKDKREWKGNYLRTEQKLWVDIKWSKISAIVVP